MRASAAEGSIDLDDQVNLEIDDCSYIKPTLNKSWAKRRNPLLDQAKFCVFLNVTAVSYGILLVRCGANNDCACTGSSTFSIHNSSWNPEIHGGFDL
jgi:hypothetical protein